MSPRLSILGNSIGKFSTGIPANTIGLSYGGINAARESRRLVCVEWRYPKSVGYIIATSPRRLISPRYPCQRRGRSIRVPVGTPEPHDEFCSISASRLFS